MPDVTGFLKNVEYWRLSSARMATGEDRPSWASDDDANGVTIATGSGSTIAVAITVTALYAQQSVQVEVAGIYEVRIDGKRIEDIEPWLDEVLAGPAGEGFVRAATNEAQTALLPYLREAVSSMIARTSLEITSLAPSPDHHSTFEVDVDLPAAKKQTLKVRPKGS